jgi:hypothetical protein
MSYGYVPAPIPQVVPQPTWYSRNWKWFLPTVILGPLLLLALVVGGLMTFVFGLMKSSEPYQYAVAVAQKDPQVLRELGGPVEPGWFTTGNINVSGSSGEADIAIPLNGKLRRGELFVVAKKLAGVWSYQRLEVLVDRHERPIPLLPGRISPEKKDE